MSSLIMLYCLKTVINLFNYNIFNINFFVYAAYLLRNIIIFDLNSFLSFSFIIRNLYAEKLFRIQKGFNMFLLNIFAFDHSKPVESITIHGNKNYNDVPKEMAYYKYFNVSVFLVVNGIY